MSSTTTTTQVKTNGHHVEEFEGGDALYKFPTGPMVLGEAPIFRKSDNTLHLVDCIKEPCELWILKLDPVTGDVVDSICHKLEESVTVQFFRRNKPGSCESLQAVTGRLMCLTIRFNRNIDICAAHQGVAFLDEATGKVEYVKKIIPDEDRGIRRFNDGMVDVKGRFWLAEIDRKALSYGAYNLPKEHGKPIGRLWRYDPDGSLHQMEDGLVRCVQSIQPSKLTR